MSDERIKPTGHIVVSLNSVAATFHHRLWRDSLTRPALADGREWYEAHCDNVGEDIARALKLLIRREFDLPGEKSTRHDEHIVTLERGPGL